jgi:hypothetical protein
VAGIILRDYALKMAKPKRLNGMSRLILVKAKVERAKQNLIDMETLLDRHYGHRVGANKHRKSAFHGMPDSYDIPMDALTAAGDVVGNLWGALDHLCYQLIDAYSPSVGEDVLEQSAFPFAKDVTRYEDAKRRRKVEFMDPCAVVVINHLKPYRGGNDALTLLNDLNNYCKHRMLVTVGSWVHASADWIGRYSPSTGFLLISGAPHFSGIYDASEVQQHPELAAGESASKFNIAGGNAMLPTLHYLIDLIDGILDPFLPFLDSK